MKFVNFTNEEKVRANEVNLVDYLNARGEKLKRVGISYFVESLNGVSVNDNKWYDHYNKVGGVATGFLKQFYGYSYVDAVVELLGEENIEALRGRATNVKLSDYKNTDNISQHNIQERQSEKKQTEIKHKKPFELPNKARSNDRLIEYLCDKRFIDKDIVNEFLVKGSLYQSEEKNNVIFVGFDEKGVARFGCAKGTYVSDKGTFTQTLPGSNCDYSFNYISKNESECLFVVEAPIDMLSLMTLMKSDRQEFNYIALDGVSEKLLLKFLENNKNVKVIYLALDNDVAGFEATEKIKDILIENGYRDIEIISSCTKDWNEDLKEANGVTPKPSVEHPKYEAYLKKVDKLLFFYKENNKTTEERVAMQYSNFIKNYKNNGFEENEEAIEKLVNNVVTLLKKHLKHIGKNVNEEKIFKSLVDNYRTYKDKTKVSSKLAELNDLMKDFNVFREKASLTEDEKVNFVKNMMHIASTSIRVDIEFDRLNEQSIEKTGVVQKSEESKENENFNEAEVSNEQVMNFG